MRSCLGVIASLLVFTLVIGGGALLWYLSSTSEFSRTSQPTAETTANP